MSDESFSNLKRGKSAHMGFSGEPPARGRDREQRSARQRGSALQRVMRKEGPGPQTGKAKKGNKGKDIIARSRGEKLKTQGGKGRVTIKRLTDKGWANFTGENEKGEMQNRKLSPYGDEGVRSLTRKD